VITILLRYQPWKFFTAAAGMSVALTVVKPRGLGKRAHEPCG
jgi:hypothetical protein